MRLPKSFGSAYTTITLSHKLLMETSTSPTVKRTKKACTECRQQKARCDVHIQRPDPCTRCQRLNVKCVISDPFKRQHKRQKLSELEEETRRLRRELSINANNTPNATGTSTEATWSPAPQLRPDQHGNLIQRNSYPIETNNKCHADEFPIYPVSAADKTVARDLDGIQVDPETIDDIFQLFFRRYQSFIPIFDPPSTPNFYFTRSPLIFWAIIGAAYPSYSTSRDFEESLMPKVYDLAFSHLNPKHASIPTIEGLLIVLNWPTPFGSLSRDTQFSLSGGMLHMAMQMGIHVPLSTQDFARVKIKSNEQDVTKRAELWAHCLLVYERICNCQGLAPINLVDTQRETGISSKVSSALKFQLKIHNTVSRCCIALQEHGLRVLSPAQEYSLEMMLRMFDGQLRDAEVDAGTVMDSFHLSACRMTIHMFYFFLKPKSLQNEIVVRVFASACHLLTSVKTLSKHYDLRTSPFYFSYAVTLSSFALSRLLKSPSAQYLNQAELRSRFSESLETLYQVALPGWDDLARRISRKIPQLLNSEKSFRKDGKDFSMLRIRSRLAMSPVFDASWWWREEFGGQMGAYTSQSEEGGRKNEEAVAQSDVIEKEGGGGNRVLESDMGLGIFGSEFWDDNLMAEFGWLGGDELLETGGEELGMHLPTE